MKFVKTITILMTFSVMIFGNWDRVSALGGNPGFWPEDDANVSSFPAMVNNLDMIQVSGAGSDSGSATVVWGEDDSCTWGFGFDGATDEDLNDWVNLMWGNGTYGATFAFGSSAWTGTSTIQGDDDEDVVVDDERSTFGIDVGLGMNMNFGELGVNFLTATTDDGEIDDEDNWDDVMGLGLNLRREQDIWLFNNMLVGFAMYNQATGDELDNNMGLSVDLFTSLPTGDGVNATFAMGFGYWNNTTNTGLDGADDVVVSMITLPAVHLGVEAEVTDWAKVRFGLNHAYVVSGSNGDDTWTGAVDNNGESNFNWNFGLGFDYGSFTLDMVLENTDLFNDPVRYIMGRNDSALSSSATLTWAF